LPRGIRILVRVVDFETKNRRPLPRDRHDRAVVTAGGENAVESESATLRRSTRALASFREPRLARIRAVHVTLHKARQDGGNSVWLDPHIDVPAKRHDENIPEVTATATAR
jgi:hypothetical protein